MTFESGVAQDQSVAGRTLAIVQRERGHDDTVFTRAPGDLDVVQAVTAIPERLYAGIGSGRVEPFAELGLTWDHELFAAFAVEPAHAAQMGREVAFLDEVGERRLQDCRRRIAR